MTLIMSLILAMVKNIQINIHYLKVSVSSWIQKQCKKLITVNRDKSPGGNHGLACNKTDF